MPLLFSAIFRHTHIHHSLTCKSNVFANKNCLLQCTTETKVCLNIQTIKGTKNTRKINVTQNCLIVELNEK